MKNKIVIIVSGGVVQSIWSSSIADSVEILDLDDFKEENSKNGNDLLKKWNKVKNKAIKGLSAIY